MDSVGTVNPDIYEFYSLGLGDPMPYQPSTGTAPAIFWIK